MKNKSVLAIPLVVFAFACGNGNGTASNADTVKTATDTTAMKTDTTATMQKLASTVSSADSTFAVNAADAGMLEIQLGTLAQSKSQNQKVKDFGSMMVTDHTKAGDQLKAIAQTKNLMLPMKLSKESEDKVDALTSKNGKEFDKAYMDAMVKGHAKVADMFDAEAKNGSDTDIKNFASTVGSTVKMHLTAAKKCDAALK